MLETFRLSISPLEFLNWNSVCRTLCVGIQTSADWLHSLRKKLVFLSRAILTAEGDEYLWSESKAFASNAKITLIWILQPVWSSHYWSRSHTLAHSHALSALCVCWFCPTAKTRPPKHLAEEGVVGFLSLILRGRNASHSLIHLVPALIELSSHLQRCSRPALPTPTPARCGDASCTLPQEFRRRTN